MKKIFAMLISLLFLGSVIGMASVGATCYVPDDITVRVGDTFTVKYPCSICEEGYLEEISDIDGYVTYKTLKPGKVKFCAYCGDPVYCGTITILSRSLPMDFFMKIFGFGKKK